MSQLPKLRIKLPSGNPSEYVCEIEQAKNCLDFSEGVFLVEGQGIQSYDELISIAAQDKCKNKGIIDVVWLQPTGGG